MTSLTERIPLDEITAQARQVRFGRTLLNLIAFTLIMTGKSAGLLWLSVVWCCLAVREGWREVHPPKPKVSDGSGRAG